VKARPPIAAAVVPLKDCNISQLFCSTVGNTNINNLKLRTLPVGDTIELISFTSYSAVVPLSLH
jgi:hypothetical protein